MKLLIAFICVGNSCRSQMAEGFARYYYENLKNNPNETKNLKNWQIEIYSAGTNPAGIVMPQAVKVMKEIGIDISRQYSKNLEEIPPIVDLVFTMGCNVDCPYLPSKLRQDWGLDDPVGMSLNFYREVRDKIQLKVKTLFEIIDNSKNIDEIIKAVNNNPNL